MKKIITKFVAVLICVLALASCKKDIVDTVIKDGTKPVINLSPSTLILNSTNAVDSVETISWTPADFGFKAAVNYTVEFVKTGNSFSSGQTINVGNKTQLKLVGAMLNDAVIGLGIAANSTGIIDVRIKSTLSDSITVYSEVAKLTVTSYQVAFPALLVRGANSWVTPSQRTNGYVLTSPAYNNKFEGYVFFPNADGYGGDALKLMAQSSGVYYGWGGSSTTIAAGVAGNLYFTPAPSYMKVNADVNAGTVSYTPVKFFLSGDHNGWSTSSTPMIYNDATKQWVATNVSFTTGNKFVFTSNGSYDISYKVNADNKLVYAGPPNWNGNNIDAPVTGIYTVILDLSAGDGSYTYKIQ